MATEKFFALLEERSSSSSAPQSEPRLLEGAAGAAGREARATGAGAAVAGSAMRKGVAGLPEVASICPARSRTSR